MEKYVEVIGTLMGCLFGHCFTGDFDSQWKVFEEMKQNDVKPNLFTFSNIMRTHLLKLVT